MSAYLIPLTCLSCGESVEPVTEGRVIAGRETAAVCRCTSCKREFSLHVSLHPMGTQDYSERAEQRAVAVCGTESGYKAHRRRGEIPCAVCKEAHSRGNSRRVSARRNPAGAFI